jgi:hypothetical protein
VDRPIISTTLTFVPGVMAFVPLFKGFGDGEAALDHHFDLAARFSLRGNGDVDRRDLADGVPVVEGAAALQAHHRTHQEKNRDHQDRADEQAQNDGEGEGVAVFHDDDACPAEAEKERGDPPERENAESGTVIHRVPEIGGIVETSEDQEDELKQEGEEGEDADPVEDLQFEVQRLPPEFHRASILAQRTALGKVNRLSFLRRFL